MKKLALLFLLMPVLAAAQNYSQEWEHGTEFTATATPNPGWEFVNWTEGGVVVSTENPYVFIVDGPRNLVANFQRLGYIIDIEVNPAGSGEIEGAGVQPAGSEVMLRAIPNDFYEFKNFVDKLTGKQITENPHRITVNRDYNMKANFTYAGPQPGQDWIYLVLIALTALFAWIFKNVKIN